MMGPITAEIPLKKEKPEMTMPVYSGLLPAHSAAALGQVDVDPPLWEEVSILAQRKTQGNKRTHERTKYYSKEVEEDGGIREAPQKERSESTAERAEDHDRRVRDAVAKMADDDRAQYHGEIEQCKDYGRGKLARQLSGERRNVERNGEVREPLHDAREHLRGTTYE